MKECPARQALQHGTLRAKMDETVPCLILVSRAEDGEQVNSVSEYTVALSACNGCIEIEP